MLWKRNKQPDKWKLQRLEAELVQHLNEFVFERKETGEFSLHQYNDGFYLKSAYEHLADNNLLDCTLHIIKTLAKGRCTIVEIWPRAVQLTGPYETEEFYDELWKRWPQTYRSILSRSESQESNHIRLTLMSPEPPMEVLRCYMVYEPLDSMVMGVHVYEEPYDEMMTLSDKALSAILNLEEETALINMYICERNELTLHFQPARMPIEQVLASIESFMKERELSLELKGI